MTNVQVAPEVDDDDAEETYEEITLGDGTVFQFWDGDEEWDPVASDLKDLKERQRRLEQLPELLEDISVRLQEFRRSAWTLRSEARDIVKHVEELSGGIQLRGWIESTPEKDIERTSGKFVGIIEAATGSLALDAHDRVRGQLEDLEASRKWVEQRDEALLIRAGAAASV